MKQIRSCYNAHLMKRKGRFTNAEIEKIKQNIERTNKAVKDQLEKQREA